MTQTLGIDVSTYQNKTPSLSGLDFLFARASIATSVDDMYPTHAANARKAGLIVGAYHFGYSTIPVADQVKVFLGRAPNANLYALDVEGPTAPSRAQARDFIARVKAAGKVCGLYHSESGFFDAGQDFDWIANWSRVPSRHYDFWQYRGSPLDLDEYNGTRAQLNALAGIKPARPSLWGSDVPAAIQAVNPTGVTVGRAVRWATGHGFGTVINMKDLAEAFASIGLGYGDVIEPKDVQALAARYKAR